MVVEGATQLAHRHRIIRVRPRVYRNARRGSGDGEKSTPVPLNETECGLPNPLSTIVSAAINCRYRGTAGTGDSDGLGAKIDVLCVRPRCNEDSIAVGGGVNGCLDRGLVSGNVDCLLGLGDPTHDVVQGSH